MTTFQTSRTPHLLLAAGLTLVTLATGPALAAEIHLDHQGSHRRFDIDQRGYGATDLTSRGDGGRLDATLRGTGETGVFMLGDGVRGQVFDAGAGGSACALPRS